MFIKKEIGFGTVIKDDEVPTWVADWLIARNQLYPKVDFTVSRFAISKSADRELCKKYETSYGFFADAPSKGILQVMFLFGQEMWNVRITGSLSAEERNSVVGVSLDRLERVERDGRVGYMQPRTTEHPFQERPTEFKRIDFSHEWTAEMTLTAQEFKESFQDPEKREALTRALAERKRNKPS